MSITDELETEVIRKLHHDVLATLGRDYEAFIRLQALNVRTFADEPSWFIEKVVEDVQQCFHDEFIDITWPRCPRHGRHPLWFHDGSWWCEQDAFVVAPLGELPGPPAATD